VAGRFEVQASYVLPTATPRTTVHGRLVRLAMGIQGGWSPGGGGTPGMPTPPSALAVGAFPSLTRCFPPCYDVTPLEYDFEADLRMCGRAPWGLGPFRQRRW